MLLTSRAPRTAVLEREDPEQACLLACSCGRQICMRILTPGRAGFLILSPVRPKRKSGQTQQGIFFRGPSSRGLRLVNRCFFFSLQVTNHAPPYEPHIVAPTPQTRAQDNPNGLLVWYILGQLRLPEESIPFASPRAKHLSLRGTLP